MNRVVKYAVVMAIVVAGCGRKEHGSSGSRPTLDYASMENPVTSPSLKASSNSGESTIPAGQTFRVKGTFANANPQVKLWKAEVRVYWQAPGKEKPVIVANNIVDLEKTDDGYAYDAELNQIPRSGKYELKVRAVTEDGAHLFAAGEDVIQVR